MVKCGNMKCVQPLEEWDEDRGTTMKSVWINTAPSDSEWPQTDRQ